MRTSLIAFAAALLMPIGVMAQSTDTTTEESTDAPSVGSAIEDQLSLGEDASAPQIGQTYTKETNGAWELRCIKTEDGNDPCQMYQLLDDGQGAPVAEEEAS